MVNTGVNLISKERERQISEEGWTPEYDDQWVESELPRAAACYAMFSSYGYMRGLRDIHRKRSLKPEWQLIRHGGSQAKQMTLTDGFENSPRPVR